MNSKIEKIGKKIQKNLKIFGIKDAQVRAKFRAKMTYEELVAKKKKFAYVCVLLRVVFKPSHVISA